MPGITQNLGHERSLWSVSPQTAKDPAPALTTTLIFGRVSEADICSDKTLCSPSEEKWCHISGVSLLVASIIRGVELTSLAGSVSKDKYKNEHSSDASITEGNIGFSIWKVQPRVSGDFFGLCPDSGKLRCSGDAFSLSEETGRATTREGCKPIDNLKDNIYHQAALVKTPKPSYRV